jgi:hypothetical protein
MNLKIETFDPAVSETPTRGLNPHAQAFRTEDSQFQSQDMFVASDTDRRGCTSSDEETWISKARQSLTR